MSRIAGYIGQTNAAQALYGMLQVLKSRREWTTKTGGMLGWTGWTTPKITARDQAIAVVDGRFYGDDEPDLVGLYREHGFESAISKLNGDFACALFDTKSNTLWLARDRFGLKPLYYVCAPDFFGFASRPSALLSLPGVSRDVNREFVALFAGSHYRYFDNRADTSPFRAISQVPAAHILQWTPQGIRVSRYWSLEDLPDFTEPESVLAEQYRDLLLNAVSVRLKTCARPAFTLSGGMDSSSVLASAVHNTGNKGFAFSSMYSDKTYDEREEIQSMLATAVDRWNPINVDVPDLFERIRRLIELHDEPVATATWLSHSLIVEEVSRQGFTGLFGGLGGDELNAGEYEYFIYRFADLKQAGANGILSREIDLWIKYHDHPIFKKTPDTVAAQFSRIVDLARPGKCLPDRSRLSRYVGAVNPEYFDLASFEPIMEHPFRSYLKNRTYQDLSRETLPCCLRAEDRQSTAYSVENYLPFLDYRLVEFMYRIPGELKIREGVTKILLRSAMKDLLPEETRTRIKKTGWNAPAHQWFSGKGKSRLMDLVRSRSFRERGVYHLPTVERIIEEHDEIVRSQRPAENHMMFLWQLTNLEIWFQWQDQITKQYS